MIGPSSSHTAGVVRLARAGRTFLDESVGRARITLFGSLAHTAYGHGTRQAAVAGLMGWAIDDDRIPDALRHALGSIEYEFLCCPEGGSRPNSLRLQLWGRGGRTLDMEGASLGGGEVLVTEIDNLPVSLTGHLPALVVFHQDRLGAVAGVSRLVADGGVNIAHMSVSRGRRGDRALMVLEVDQAVPVATLDAVAALEYVSRAVFVPVGF